MNEDAVPPQDPLYQAMGLVQVIEMSEEGRSRLEYEARPEMCHSGGVVQGGFVTGWIDAAMAHAAIAMNGAGVTPMTLEIKTSFFAPTRPGRVIAEAWVVKPGRRTCYYEGQLLAPDGTVLAKASSTILLADRSKVEGAAKAAKGNGA